MRIITEKVLTVMRESVQCSTKLTVHINFILVGLFGIHISSHVDIISFIISRYIMGLHFWIVFIKTRISLY